MKLVYIGEHFYRKSGSAMSPIYTEGGMRSDWGFVQVALSSGDEVHIRQATPAELDRYEAMLSRIKQGGVA